MTNETVTLENIPDVTDIWSILKAIQSIGAHVEKIDRHCYRITGSMINHDAIVDNDYVRKIRGSYYLIGSLWASTAARLGASGRMQYRPPSDRPAHQGIPRSGRGSASGASRHGHRTGGSPARCPHLHGCGFRRSDDQYHDGFCHGRGCDDHRKRGQRAPCRRHCQLPQQHGRQHQGRRG